MADEKQDQSQEESIDQPTAEQAPSSDAGRRDFIATGAMAAGLVGGYGMFGYISLRFLFPSTEGETALQFVMTTDRLKVGESAPFTAPDGSTMVIARNGEGETAEDFIALSSVCPHLGCQVHWVAKDEEFFCPCHNGAFNAKGEPTKGPPKYANQALTKFELEVVDGKLFVRVPLKSVREDERGMASRDAGQQRDNSRETRMA